MVNDDAFQFRGVKMTRLNAKIFLISALVFSIAAMLPSYCSATTRKFTYDFYINNGSIWNPWESHKLHVSVTQSLYEYYQGKDHSRHSNSDYPKFVTPEAVKPIAERIWSICQYEAHSEEQFVNAVLMFVHQIPYFVSYAKYPVETILENSGDCDVLSLLAASVMKAKDFDVALLYWEEEPAHMNLGIYLPDQPVYSREGPWYIPYEGKEYYIAECTGNNSMGYPLYYGWRVGECPDEYKHSTAKIIGLENCEISSPAQVSASVDNDLSTSYFATLSGSYKPPLYVGERIEIQGTVAPAHSGKSVVLYYRKGTASWDVTDTTTTDYAGAFSFTVSFNFAGTYYLRASWSGDVDHAGADSTILTFDVSLAPSYIYVTLSPSTIHLGETVTVAGFISPVHSYQSVSLYYRQNEYEWMFLATVITDFEGQFSYQWIPDSVGTFYLKAEWSGDSDHQGATSEICTAMVPQDSSSITIASSSSSINLGETIALSGEISPMHGNVNVEIYVSEDEYQWSLLTSVITNMQGQYTYQWKPSLTGMYYFKACWSGDADHAGAESDIHTLEVTQSSPTNPDDQGTPNPSAPDDQNSETTTPNYFIIALPIIIGISIITIGTCLLILLQKRSKNFK